MIQILHRTAPKSAPTWSSMPLQNGQRRIYSFASFWIVVERNLMTVYPAPSWLLWRLTHKRWPQTNTIGSIPVRGSGQLLRENLGTSANCGLIIWTKTFLCSSSSKKLVSRWAADNAPKSCKNAIRPRVSCLRQTAILMSHPVALSKMLQMQKPIPARASLSTVCPWSIVWSLLSKKEINAESSTAYMMRRKCLVQICFMQSRKEFCKEAISLLIRKAFLTGKKGCLMTFSVPLSNALVLIPQQLPGAEMFDLVVEIQVMCQIACVCWLTLSNAISVVLALNG